MRRGCCGRGGWCSSAATTFLRAAPGRPVLGRVQHPEDLDGLTKPIHDNPWSSRDDKLAGRGDPPDPADLRKLGKPLDRSTNPSAGASGGCRIIRRDIVYLVFQVAECRPQP